MKTPYKSRIQVAVGVLDELTRNIDQVDRAKAVEILKKHYQAKKIQPIRGRANPPDIYDKELTTIYVIGKYGLRIDEDYPELFEKVFYIEKTLDEVVNDILNSKYSEAREKLRSISPSGVIDSNLVARLLRLPLTMLIFGFIGEEDFKKILHEALKAFPEEEKTISNNYARFFVAFKVAEAIYNGEVKTREEKEALKKALAIRIEFPRATPSDSYIYIIASEVFNVNKKILDKILEYKRREERQETSDSPQEIRQEKQ